jgi:hypothetical protein
MNMNNSAEQDQGDSSSPDFRLLLAGIVLLTIPLLMALLPNELFGRIAYLLRLFAALGGGLIAACIPGFMNIELPYLKAGGALAAVVLVYTTNPAESLHNKEEVISTGNEEDRQCLQINGMEIEPRKFHSLQEFTENAKLTLKGINHCEDPIAADGYYVRFYGAAQHSIVVPRVEECKNEKYNPSCWYFESPAPMPFKKGEWATEIIPPSFESISDVSGPFSFGWEVRDYEIPQKKPLGGAVQVIRIIN